MNKSISDFIMEQESGVQIEETTLDTAYMEMAIATNLAEAYADNAAIVEFCTENEIVITEGFGETMKSIGTGLKNLPNKVWTFLKALVRNIINAVAADKIDKAIGYIKESNATKFSVKFPNIEQLLDDITEFKEWVGEGLNAKDRGTSQLNKISAILNAANSEAALEKRYYDRINKNKGTESENVKAVSLTKEEYIDLLRKVKDNKVNIKAKKILEDLDKDNFKTVDENGNAKVSGDTIKSVKQITKMYVKLYDDFYKAIATAASKLGKDLKKDMSKEEKDEAQERIKDERKRESSVKESYYV